MSFQLVVSQLPCNQTASQMETQAAEERKDRPHQRRGKGGSAVESKETLEKWSPLCPLESVVMNTLGRLPLEMLS
jgi:hypothetical protein